MCVYIHTYTYIRVGRPGTRSGGKRASKGGVTYIYTYICRERERERHTHIPYVFSLSLYRLGVFSIRALETEPDVLQSQKGNT